MDVKALAIYAGRDIRVGVLFQYAMPGAPVINRFVADEAFIALPRPPALSLSYAAPTPEDQAALWRNIRSSTFNGRASVRNGWLLPAFFQNLLPEGVFRDHVAALRRCDPQDHFEMLAACGRDLPGNVYALPVELSRDELARYVTQDQDALEMSVTADPLEGGVSLSGVQPKLGVIREGDRYVGRTKDHDTHIIAKLPVVGQPRLPEVEDLTLRLALAAGIDACEAYLEPLEKLAMQHGYDLGESSQRTHFLAVVRFDRSPQGRIHCEDLAQVLGEMPEDKYGGARPVERPVTYLDVAAVLMGVPSMGEPAVHELLRRLVFNELVGNPDMHLKNIGLRYADGVTPKLSPAYDLVAYAAFNRIRGHALMIVPPALLPLKRGTAPGDAGAKQSLTPSMLRTFCQRLGIAEKPAAQVITRCVKAAFTMWPDMIERSTLTAQQKTRLMAQLMSHPLIESLARRVDKMKNADNGMAPTADDTDG